MGDGSGSNMSDGDTGMRPGDWELLYYNMTSFKAIYSYTKEKWGKKRLIIK